MRAREAVLSEPKRMKDMGMAPAAQPRRSILFLEFGIASASDMVIIALISIQVPSGDDTIYPIRPPFQIAQVTHSMPHSHRKLKTS
jgi:hypothetical protein